MRTGRLFVAVTVALSVSEVRAADHLVSRETIEVGLVEAAAASEQDLARIDRLLALPRAAEAATALGVDVLQLRRAAPTLTDQEIRSLLARTEALESDPAAGLSGNTDDLLVVLLVVLIVLLVLKAV